MTETKGDKAPNEKSNGDSKTAAFPLKQTVPISEEPDEQQYNWRGIFISAFVISTILCLVMISVAILTPEERESLAGPRIALWDAIDFIRFNPSHFNGTWVSRTQFVYRLYGKGVCVFHENNLTSTLLVSERIFRQFNADHYVISPSLKFILLLYEIEKSGFQLNAPLLPKSAFQLNAPLLSKSGFQLNAPLLPKSGFQLNAPLLPKSAFQLNAPLLPKSGFQLNTRLLPKSGFQLNAPLLPKSGFQLNTPLLPKSAFQLNAPLLPKSGFQLNAPLLPKSGFQLNAPLLPKSGFQLNAPLLPKSAFQLNAPLLPKSGFQLNAPLLPKSGFQLNAPLLPKSGFQLNAPLLPKSGFQLNAPLLPKSAFQLNAPLLPKSGFQLNAPLLPKSGFQLNAPLLPKSGFQLNAPLLPKSGFQLNAPLLPKSAFQLNAPLLPKSGFQLNAPLLPKSAFQLNAPLLPKSGFQLNAPLLPKSGFQLNAPLLPKSGFQLNAPLLPKSGFQLKATLLPKSGFQLKAPLLRNPGFQLNTPLLLKSGFQLKATLLPKSGFQLKATLLPKSGFQLNAPLLPKSGFQLNPPLLRKSGFQLNAPLLRNPGFQLNTPLLPKSGFQLNAPLLPKSGFQLNAPLLRNPGFQLNTPLLPKSGFQLKATLLPKSAFQLKAPLLPKSGFQLKAPVRRTNKKVEDEMEPPPLQWAGWTVQDGLIFVQDNNVFFLHDVGLGHVQQMTFSGIQGLHFNGVPDLAYQGHIMARDNAIWMSPEAPVLLFASFDDTEVPKLMIQAASLQQGQTMPTHSPRYPKMDTPLPSVSLWFIDASRSPANQPVFLKQPQRVRERAPVLLDAVWLDMDNAYTAWSNQGSSLLVLTKCQGKSWYCHEIFVEENQSHEGGFQATIGYYPSLIPSVSGEAVVFLTSQPFGGLGELRVAYFKGGRRWSYVLNPSYEDVVHLIAWDQRRGRIYYVSRGPRGERHIRWIPYGAVTEFRRTEASRCLSCGLTSEDTQSEDFPAQTASDGVNQTTARPIPCMSYEGAFNPSYEYVVLDCRGPGIPTQTLFRIGGDNDRLKKLVTLETNQELLSEFENLSLPHREWIRLDLGSGSSSEVEVLLPPGMRLTDEAQVPLVIQMGKLPSESPVPWDFRVTWGDYLASNLDMMYARINIETPATTNDGLTINRLNVRNHIAAVRLLVDSLPLVNRSSVAVLGWGVGGYLALETLATFTRKDVKCGISVAPVTAWTHANSFLAGRIFGPLTPETRLDYINASLLHRGNNFKTRHLLMVHGTRDLYVPLEHSIMFSHTLTKAGVYYEQLFYPDAGHLLQDVLFHFYSSAEIYLRNCFNSGRELEFEDIVYTQHDHKVRKKHKKPWNKFDFF
ncbi:unnamed protein product [Cyprideis torosa]|uniref:Uncharacterized protein n=1 Tax=Cyprideis torosa TaxID=163714 RepID=A0A7R8W885_9CRUS|nr:unnamed protein product [Cyprideis torosa]CAG0888331.1 unnamed protein product [Cyprideis torosa]